MRIIRHVYIYSVLVLGFFISALLGFLDFRSLIMGDMLLFNNVGCSVVANIFRINYFLGLMGMCAFLFVSNIKRERTRLWAVLLVTVMSLSSFFLFFYYEWYIALIFVIIVLGVFSAGLINIFRIKKVILE